MMVKTMEHSRPKKRPRPSAGISTTSNVEVPTFSGEDLAAIVASDAFLQAWESYQVVYLPRSDKKTPNKNPFRWEDIQNIFQNLTDQDRDSICIENDTGSKDNKPTTTNNSEPISYFQVTKRGPQTPYYCSFLVQNDNLSLQNLLSSVPVDILHSKWTHEPCVWIFFGRTPEQQMQGRPEHTDSICHDGTWHYQVNGIKQWLLRPTAKLLEQWENQPDSGMSKDAISRWKKQDDSYDDEEEYRATVNCRQGDILVINTRLWFHQTLLPAQPEPSVSYARDFWARAKPNEDLAADQDHSISNKGCMTNMDGLYATNDIAEGTILFRDTDMPNCELHRSKDNPNCDVVELEDGTSAVVSSRLIASGEFFCIAESDDDEEEWEDEDEFEEYEDASSDEDESWRN